MLTTTQLIKVYYDNNKKFMFLYQAYDTDWLHEISNDRIEWIYKKSIFPFFSLIRIS